MIYGVQLGITGIDSDGEYLEQQKVTLAIVRNSEDTGDDVEITVPDDTIYSVDLAALKRALAYAEAELAVAQEDA